MYLIDKLRTLAGNKPKCVKILETAENKVSDNTQCSEVNCQEKAEKKCRVNKCDKDGTITDNNIYIAPFCKIHSEKTFVQEIKFHTKINLE